MIVLAERYHWTPQQIEALDPEYVAELLVFLRAHADHQTAEAKKAH